MKYMQFANVVVTEDINYIVWYCEIKCKKCEKIRQVKETNP